MEVPKLNLSIVNASAREHEPITSIPKSSSSSPTRFLKSKGFISTSSSARRDIDELSIKNTINYGGEFKSKSARLKESFLDSSREAAFIIKTPRYKSNNQ